jgi:predicted nucleic acid-binding Zn ribbon protein
MNHKNTVTVKQALEMMVSDLKLKGKLDESRIRDAWGEIMGKPIAKYTTKISLNKSKLYVQVNSAALKNELTYSKEKIKEVFNKELGSAVIKEVIIY